MSADCRSDPSDRQTTERCSGAPGLRPDSRASSAPGAGSDGTPHRSSRASAPAARRRSVGRGRAPRRRPRRLPCAASIEPSPLKASARLRAATGAEHQPKLAGGRVVEADGGLRRGTASERPIGAEGDLAPTDVRRPRSRGASRRSRSQIGQRAEARRREAAGRVDRHELRRWRLDVLDRPSPGASPRR